MVRSWKTWIVAGLVVAVLGGLGLALADDKKADATLKLSEGSVAVGIGWSWGKGHLSYQGKTHKFKIEGLSIGEVGMTKAEATGEVFNLKSLDDFNGVYAAASAEATGGKGAGITAVINPKGVRIVLKSETKGGNLKVAAEGIKFTLEK